MKPADIAADYRKRAALWRNAAENIRKKALPKGQFVADKLAERWEARASQFDDDAEMYDAQARIASHDRQPEA